VTFRIITLLAVVLFVGMAGWHRDARRAAAAVSPPGDAAKRWRGVSSCAAASCHGGTQVGSKGSELTTWASTDPHARAYAVLFDERSRHIVKNYYQLTDIRDSHPEKRSLCLRCHLSGDVVHETTVPTRFHADGVSCESCHGPAESWLTRHYRAEWKRLSPQEKAATGFRITKDVLTRAQDCTTCHVGTAAAEVNHDVLAAGHPRLAFEFASFQAIYPKHWRAADDRQRFPDFEARSWAVGQIVAAKASLDLLAARAGNSDAPWPEWAENRCYGCHQNLQARPSARKSGAEPPLMQWNEWYVAEIPTVMGSVNRPELPELVALRAELGRNFPRRDVVGPLASRASGQLADWLRQPLPPMKPSEVGTLLNNRLTALADKSADDWDRAAQDYLAAAALHHALKDMDPRFDDPAARAALRNRLRELAFPPGSSSPTLRRTEQP
jgi:hypothetical protein